MGRHPQTGAHAVRQRCAGRRGWLPPAGPSAPPGRTAGRSPPVMQPLPPAYWMSCPVSQPSARLSKISAGKGLPIPSLSCIMFVSQFAGMMELVDVTDSKSVGGNIVSVRVRLPAPARRKRHIACDEFFHFIAKLIARLFCCSSLPKRTRCRWAPIWGRRFAAVLSILRSKVRVALASFYAQGKKDIIRPLPYFPFPTATRCAGPAVGRQPSGVAFHAPSPNPLDGGFINSLEGRSGRMSSPALEAVSAWGEVERPGRRAGRRAHCPKRRFWVRIHAPPGSTPAAPPRCPAVFLHCLQCPRPQCFPRCLRYRWWDRWKYPR